MIINHKSFDRSKADIVFINYGDAECGCSVAYSDGKGQYSDAIYIKLCGKHKKQNKKK